MVTLKLFATIKNDIGKGEVEISLEKQVPVSELKEIITAQIPEIGKYLKHHGLMIAVNQEVSTNETIVKDGDEVALLPSFSGG